MPYAKSAIYAVIVIAVALFSLALCQLNDDFAVHQCMTKAGLSYDECFSAINRQ